jgi:hypothetical protein
VACTSARSRPHVTYSTIANRTAVMASSSDADIEAIANLNNEFFYIYFFEE